MWARDNDSDEFTHALKTPLAHIRLAVQLLLHKGGLDEWGHRWASDIVEASRELEYECARILANDRSTRVDAAGAMDGNGEDHRAL